MKRFLIAFLALLVTGSVVGCGGKEEQSDIELDSEGGVVVRPGQEETIVTFWMYGDQVELDVYKKLVQEFNAKYEGAIEVDLVVKQADGYTDALNLTLNGTTAPDLFYVSETGFKNMAELGYLYDISDYVKNSKEYDITKIWPSAVTRFQYDIKNKVNIGPESKYYAVPKDIGPTVIFYNETMFNQAGVKVLSVAAEDLAAFNSGSKADDRGNTKAALGIAGDVKEKGYFVDTNGQKWFNNQVEMSWEETVALSNVIQEHHDPTGSKNIYGYFTEWWFNYGWSVGGDCIQYIESDAAGYTGGYWDFTLMDDSANYIVADDAEPFTINGNTYQPGEIISYQDKLVNEAPAQMGVMDRGVKTIEPAVLTACQNGQLNKLPSQRAAFTEFVRLAAKKSTLVDTVNGQNLMGYGITPYPQSIGGDSGKTAAFATGKVAMLVDGRWNVTNFREQMDGKYAWDVAPLPIYKEYDSEGNITVHGVNAGHSGSVGVAIWSQTQVANAAWKFVEYIGGEYGQSEQSKTGFAIPLQKHLAADEEIFLQTNQNPRNSKIFLDAAEFEIAGDWWYLKDNEWIDPWAGRLNGDVRNGKLTLSGFYDCPEYSKTYATLLKYTEKD